MPFLLLFIVIAGSLFLPSVRRILFDVRVRHFLRILCFTTVAMLLFGTIAFAGWYWWTVIRPTLPHNSWSDETIELDVHPLTPNKNGRTVTPTIVQ